MKVSIFKSITAKKIIILIKFLFYWVIVVIGYLLMVYGFWFVFDIIYRSLVTPRLPFNFSIRWGVNTEHNFIRVVCYILLGWILKQLGLIFLNKKSLGDLKINFKDKLNKIGDYLLLLFDTFIVVTLINLIFEDEVDYTLNSKFIIGFFLITFGFFIYLLMPRKSLK